MSGLESCDFWPIHRKLVGVVSQDPASNALVAIALHLYQYNLSARYDVPGTKYLKRKGHTNQNRHARNR